MSGYKRINVRHEQDPETSAEGPAYYADMLAELHEFVPGRRLMPRGGGWVKVGDAMAETFEELKATKRPAKAAPRPEPVVDPIIPLLVRQGVPERFVDRRFATWKPQHGTASALKCAQAIADGGRRSLVLVGSPGVGKTHLAVSILAARAEAWLARYPSEIIELDGDALLARPPFRSRFSSVPRLLDDIRAGYQFAGQFDPLRELWDVPLLVLDDLGREKSTEWVIERLYVLIDHRYGARLPTVVTTNYSLDEFAQRDYAAMLSRLAEDGAFAEVKAADHRLEAVS